MCDFHLVFRFPDRFSGAQAVGRVLSGLLWLRIGTSCRLCVISGFHHNVNEICALYGFYAALIGNSIPVFQDNVLVLS